ncbi:hypothetical protein CISG_04772 [Coccidioides immitis RMSCC 3703]|uniref:Uncharacterized protein n=1 Tax=Coccidioides immitis RMSCC 3703 TaxID=454286 RepID=A0A0J8QVL3_COCIT|nr:hypothetical protein CISG_04772 [Coccidioides immitis RMSCC 3703]
MAPELAVTTSSKNRSRKNRTASDRVTISSATIASVEGKQGKSGLHKSNSGSGTIGVGQSAREKLSYAALARAGLIIDIAAKGASGDCRFISRNVLGIATRQAWPSTLAHELEGEDVWCVRTARQWGKRERQRKTETDACCHGAGSR